MYIQVPNKYSSPFLLNEYCWYDKLLGPSQQVVTLFFQEDLVDPATVIKEKCAETDCTKYKERLDECNNRVSNISGLRCLNNFLITLCDMWERSPPQKSGKKEIEYQNQGQITPLHPVCRCRAKTRRQRPALRKSLTSTTASTIAQQKRFLRYAICIHYCIYMSGLRCVYNL